MDGMRYRFYLSGEPSFFFSPKYSVNISRRSSRFAISHPKALPFNIIRPLTPSYDGENVTRLTPYKY